MKPRLNLNDISFDIYKSIVEQALNNTTELMKVINNDYYAETLIKVYAELRKTESNNINEFLSDLTASMLEQDQEVKDRHDLVSFQVEEAREALVTYLIKKMNASYSGAFAPYARYCEGCKASEMWFGFDNEGLKYTIFEDQLDALIMFVKKG